MKTKPVDTSRFTHLYPFASHFMQIDGFRYHYIDEGAGEPMVMIHGNPTWSFYFRKLILAFSTKFRTIAVDHIGCGLSDKPSARQYAYTLKRRVHDFSVFMEKIALHEKVTLVLHDWGGMIGMAYALEHLERIRRLIVLNTAAFLPPAGKRLPFRLWMVRHLHLPAAVSILGFNLFARSALHLAANHKLPSDVKSGLIAPYNCWQNRIATLMFVRDIPIRSTDPSWPIVKQVDENLDSFKHIPMLICWGLKDFVFDTDYLAQWRQRFPRAAVHAFEDAGHYILEDAPQKVIDTMADFMLNN